MDFEAELAKDSDDQSYAFVEKLWAVRRIGEIIDELDLNGENEELTKELVLLSTQHGILTPYTSFLADETVRPTELAASDSFRRNAANAVRELEVLDEASGEAGVAQRAEKQRARSALRRQSSAEFYNDASRPSSSLGGYSAPAAPGAAASGALAGQSAQPPASQPVDPNMLLRGATVYQDAKSDRLIVASSVRQVGQDTLYKRGSILCTPETAELFSEEDGLKLDLEKLKDKVKVIERFTPEYFALSTANSAQENQLLASQVDGEELLIELRGQAYLIK
ncbi:MAG: hypothetical protein R3B90_17425 [Planctomycetaceae bacterium]